MVIIAAVIRKENFMYSDYNNDNLHQCTVI